MLYQNILRDVALEKDEVVVRAEPYFFSLDDYEHDLLDYTWTVNGETLENKDKKTMHEVTFRKEGEKGAAKILLDILDNNLPIRVLQKASRSLNINIEQ